MAYITLADFTAYIGSEIGVDQESIQRALNAAEAAINDHCGRHFNVPAGGPTTKNYAPDDGDSVTIHDLVDATGLTVTDNGVAVAAADFQLEPLQQWAGARSFYRIRRLRGWWYQDCGRPTVAVTSAKWGWAATPPEVIQATAILAKDLVDIRQARFGVAGFAEFGVVRVRGNPVVEQLLDTFQHPSKIGVA